MENEIFSREDTNVKEAIDLVLKKSLQSIPKNDMDYFKIIYESLVNKYSETKNAIEKIKSEKFEKIHMIGGGAKSAYLCQLIADTLKLPLVAGPYEATALGNILVQLETLGELDSIEQGLNLMKKSQKVDYYKVNLQNF